MSLQSSTDCQIAGGGELLRDEIIYVAHKAARPSKYPTSQIHLDKYPKQKQNVDKYGGTNVFLQVFDDCAHVIFLSKTY